MGGLLFGYLVDDARRAVRCFGSDHTGHGFRPDPMMTVFHYPSAKVGTWRISTFLDEDAINSDQKAYLSLLEDVRSGCGENWPGLLRMVLAPDAVGDSVNIPDMLQTVERFGADLRHPRWARVIRPAA